MSEAELQVLRVRLIGGQLAKASGGELRRRCPWARSMARRARLSRTRTSQSKKPSASSSTPSGEQASGDRRPALR